MIPILFEKTDTDFTTHGLCRLSDALSTEAYTEGNGQREFTLEYPVTGENYDEILIERIIGAYADDSKSVQGYRIYAITKPINGIVTIYAHHVSYDLSGKIVTVPSGSYTPSSLMALLFSGTSFTGWSDIADSKTVSFSVPTSVASILGGVEGSILDIFGGEYEFDNFTVKLHAQKGADNGVIVEYGKNITNIVDEYNTEGVFTSIVPYASYTDADGNEQVVVGDKITFNSILTTEKTAAIDFTDRFDYDTVPTKAALATLGNAYIANNNPGNTVSNINLSFVPLWYDGSDDSVGLYDTITARHTKLGVDKKVKVVAIWYDCLAERISRMTCGRLSSNFVSTVVDLQNQEAKTAKEITAIPDRWKQAVEAATRAITGNDGGYAVLHVGANGRPYEILILDNPDIEQAQNVWRWGLGGLGFSSNGYAGPYETAITADGQIVADFITTGTLQVLDSLGQIIFSANADTKAVQIAGFNVRSDRLTATRTGTQTSSSYDVVPGSQYTQTVNIAPNQIDTTYDYWRYSEDTQSAFNAFYQWWLNPHRLRFRGDFRNDPDNPRRSEATYDPWGVNLYSYTATDPETMTSGTQVSPVRMINRNDANNTRGYHGSDHVNLVDFTNNVQASLHPDALRMYNASDSTQATKYSKLAPTALDFFENGVRVGSISADGSGSTYDSGTVSSVPNETWTTLAQLTIPRGTWLIVLHASFQSNASGTRRLLLSASQDSGAAPSDVYVDYRSALPSGVRTHCHVVAVRKVTSDTPMYINAYQGSGGTLSATWQYQLTRIM